MPHLLNTNQVLDGLRGLRLHGPVVYNEVTGSTNDDARQLALEEAAEGTIVIADSQTGGRGRHGRVWLGEPGHSLLFSVILRPGIPTTEYHWLVNVSGVAAATACAALSGRMVGTKWPNDIVFAGRKLGGVLLEARAPEFAVVGIGLNISTSADGFPQELQGTAVSLAELSQDAIPREHLLVRVLRELDALYGLLQTGQTDRILSRQQQLETLLGQQVTAQLGTERLTGVARALAPTGGLIIDTAAGERIIETGEVTLLRPTYPEASA